MNKLLLGVLAVFGVAIVGSYLFTVARTYSVASFGVATSTAGATFNSAKVAAVTMYPTTASATTTSILNSDSKDRIVTDGFASCSGVGTSYSPVTGNPTPGLPSTGWTLFVATSSASGANIATTSAFLALKVPIATTSPEVYIASSTYPTAYPQRWNAGSYLTFTYNATNTAACLVGVHYLGD